MLVTKVNKKISVSWLGVWLKLLSEWKLDEVAPYVKKKYTWHVKPDRWGSFLALKIFEMEVF